jgi:endoglucanase
MDIDLFRRLCETPGVPGREERVRAVVEAAVRGTGRKRGAEAAAPLFDEIRTDAMGSLICTRKPTAKRKGSAKPTRVLVAAHMDEIGFYVRHVDENGFLWLRAACSSSPNMATSRAR